VRKVERDVALSSLRYQAEMDHVRDPVNVPEHVRLSVHATCTAVEAAELAASFGINEDALLLRCEHEQHDGSRRGVISRATTWVPEDLVGNRATFDRTCVGWPAGTMRQLAAAGVEVDQVVDDVTSYVPSAAEAQAWALAEGVPLLRVRTTAIDAASRIVAVSDAQHRADRTNLTFPTRLASHRPVDDPDSEHWTVDLAEELLRLAQPSGSTFLRALIDEGGTATAERLRELTGADALQYMTLSLNSALRKMSGPRRMLGRQLAKPRQNAQNPRHPGVYDYTLPGELVPIFDEALHRLGR